MATEDFSISALMKENARELGLGTPKTKGKKKKRAVKTRKTRDPRRRFSSSQQKRIWDLQKGKCAMCGEKLLSSTTQYDHIIPWEDNGPTIISNGQALCPDCHAKKTNRETVRKLEGKEPPKSKGKKKVRPSNPMLEQAKRVRSGEAFWS